MTAGPAQAKVTFAAISRSDLPLVARWLAEPHVVAWWGDPEEQMALLAGDIDEPLMEGFIFSVDGVPVGYIQSFPAAAWPGHPFGDLADGSAMAVDMFLAETSHLGKGFGSLALAAFADKLFANGALRVLIDPDPQNLRAIRSYSAAGFATTGTGRSADGDALVMMKERPEWDRTGL